MMKTTLLIVFFVITVLNDAVVGVDYCRSGLCTPITEEHVGCGATGKFGPECPAERTLVPMTASLKAYLLKKHNEARASVANGKIAGYSTANRMIQMTWSDELAKLAKYNALTCVYGHDECRSTDYYPYAGQNIAIVMSLPDYYTPIKAIDYLFGKWFDEYKDCDMTYIRKYRPSDTDEQIGHFTQIVSAGAKRLGCAITTWASTRKNVYIVCNYALTNMLGLPIYTTGKPCSACTTGCSKTYPGLCNSSEFIPWP